jgi:hypothetical protein
MSPPRHCERSEAIQFRDGSSGLLRRGVGTDRADVQVSLKAHHERNLAEYQGRTEIDERLLADLIRCTKRLEAAVTKLEPPKEG